VRRLRSFLDRLDQHDAGSQPDAWHRAEPVMRHVQHLSVESLVKMDHFQKEPPLNLKGPLGAPGGRKGPEPTILKEQIGNPAQTECPLCVISGYVQCKRLCLLYPESRTFVSTSGVSA
jgi:hypothetical protein